MLDDAVAPGESGSFVPPPQAIAAAVMKKTASPESHLREMFSVMLPIYEPCAGFPTTKVGGAMDEGIRQQIGRYSNAGICRPRSQNLSGALARLESEDQMKEVIALLVVMGSLAGDPRSDQAQKPAAAPRVGACTVMPRQVVEKHTVNKQMLKYMQPEETPIGAIGSMCDYGSLGLQVNPFASTKPSSPGKEWQPVAGIGDGAFFRDNNGMFAEMIVWTGVHHFTLQYSVHSGKSAEAMKPILIEFANAIIPRLR